jgi:hypothetical protein
LKQRDFHSLTRSQLSGKAELSLGNIKPRDYRAAFGKGDGSLRAAAPNLQDMFIRNRPDELKFIFVGCARAVCDRCSPARPFRMAKSRSQ